ncbi:hypothetical protein CPB84DRAFT_1690722, partial [Gymnopilus junonius]
DVFIPPVTYPTNGTVWHINERTHVSWDTSNAPVNITNPIGLILLCKSNIGLPGKLFHSTATLYPTLLLILGNGFSILQGKVGITVPWVVDSDNYQVDHDNGGNFLPFFMITGSGVSF